MAAVRLVLAVFLLIESAAAVTYSWRLIHRYSEEMKAFRVSVASKGGGDWPVKKSVEYYRMLVDNDVERQKMKVGPQSNFLFPSQGSQTMSLGNDFGWLVFNIYFIYFFLIICLIVYDFVLLKNIVNN